MKKNIISVIILLATSIWCKELNAQVTTYFAGTGSGTGNTGFYCTAVGYNALAKSNSGFHNTAFGFNAMLFNTTGRSNTSLGAQSLLVNTSGNYNTAIGDSSLLNNSTGSNNVAAGFRSLFNNKTGIANTAVGNAAMQSNVEGIENTAIGNLSMFLSVSGNSNSALGFQTLYRNSGSANTALGYKALYNNGNGFYNTGTGGFSLFNNTVGKQNTAVGYNTLSKNTLGNSNVAIGYSAGQFRTIQTNCTYIGVSSDANVENLTNATAIGYSAKVTASNKVRIGNASVTVIGGAVNWSITTAPATFISNKRENVPGLLFINKLKPFTYNVDEERFANFLGMADSLTDTDRKLYSIASKKLRTGLLPEDVEKTAKEIGYDFDGIKAPQNEKDNYNIAYADFVPSLVKAVQELSAQVDDLKNEISKLKAETPGPDKQNNSIYQNALSQTASVELPVLFQNTPNPFAGNTTIMYVLPKNYHSAFIEIYDYTSRLLQKIALKNEGPGQVTVNSSIISAGAYIYALFVNNKLIASKQMISMK